MESVHRFNFTVSAEVMDENRHANNIAYVHWMQEAAIQHSTICGGTRLAQSLGATWVIRRHRIEYLNPAFAGDAITVETWVANFRKVRSLRRYKFIRVADQTVLAEAETDWVVCGCRNRASTSNSWRNLEGFWSPCRNRRGSPRKTRLIESSIIGCKSLI
jgi:acyl-CoA thioester hydrolase